MPGAGRTAQPLQLIAATGERDGRSGADGGRGHADITDLAAYAAQLCGHRGAA